MAEYIIKNPSNELLLEPIQESPVENIKEARLTFVAGGINLPWSEELNQEAYMRMCEEYGLAPYTHLKFDYDERQKCFVAAKHHSTDVMLEVTRGAEGSQSALAISSLIQGDKPHGLSFFMGNWNYAQDGLDYLNRELLSSLLTRQYEPLEGYMALTADGKYPGIQLNFGTHATFRSFKMTTPEIDGPMESSEYLVEWFHEIAKRHKAVVEERNPYSSLRV